MRNFTSKLRLQETLTSVLFALSLLVSVLALMTQASGRGLRRKDLTVASCRLCLRSQALSPRVLEELSSAKSHLREFGGRSVPSGVFRWDHGPRQHLH